MTESGVLEKVRSDVRGRNAAKLLSAVPLFSEYNYTNKFRKATRGAKGAGHRFEAKVSSWLEENYDWYISSLAFSFSTEYAFKTICIPDGLFFNRRKRTITICEMKLRHTFDSWYQLKFLYGPVVKKAFPGWQIRKLEICKTYEPGLEFPEPFVIVQEFEKFNSAGAELGVWIWGSG